MAAVEGMQQDQRVPRLANGWEAKAADLSPEEGFLLSRIDGVTSWGVLRTIAGLPPQQVDDCLERWGKDGLLEIEGFRKETPTGEYGPRTIVPEAKGRAAIDPNLEISVEFQQEILDFETKLERPYHEILGVKVDAKTRAIKRAYFKLSKSFHPDRYFRREIGPFAEHLDRVFKKVALAYELMMDPTTREELQRSFQAAPPPPEPAPEPQQAKTARKSGPKTKPLPHKFTKKEWLARMHKRFKIPDEVLAERRFRARELCEAARVAQHQGSWSEAASAIRLAIAFDPWTDAFKELFAEIQVEVNQIRAEALLEEASGAWDSSSRKEALALYEEVIAYRPADAGAHERAARLAMELDDHETAQEYAEHAVELEPELASYHLTLGRVLRRAGLKKRAKTALEAARKLDPKDPEIQDELKKLRPARSSGGKR